MIEVVKSTLIKPVDKRQSATNGMVVCANFYSEDRTFAADFHGDDFPLEMLPLIVGKEVDVIFVPIGSYKNFYRKKVLPFKNQPIDFQVQLLSELCSISKGGFLRQIPWREEYLVGNQNLLDIVESTPEKEVLEQLMNLDVDDLPEEKEEEI